MPTRRLELAVRFGSLVLPLLLPSLASAATYSVTTLADDTVPEGLCTLREAIALHNGAPKTNDCGVVDAGDDVIDFAVEGTLRLNPKLGELLLKAPALTIAGPGASKVILHGAKAMTILVLDAANPPALTVRAVTLRNGLGSAPIANGNPVAGGIRMNNLGSWVYGPPATIVVEDAVFFANSSPIVYGTGSGFWSRGAAISSYGNLVLRRTLFEANQSDTGSVYHDGPALVEDCEFRGNHSTATSSAITLAPPGPWTIRRTLFRDNDSTLDGAAALRLISYTNLDLGLIENCTFAGSSTSQGAVLVLQGKVAVRSSTFVGNGAGAVFPGGVIESYASSLEVASNLFSGNHRPDLFDGMQGSAPLKVAYNLFESLPAELPPGVPCAPSTAGDSNLCGVIAPGIGPLGLNGGPTATYPLLPGSPALGSGSNPGGLATDQRGAGYPRTLGIGTDIGAYEAPLGANGAPRR